MLGKYQRFCQANGYPLHRVVVCRMMRHCRHKSPSLELIPSCNSVYQDNCTAWKGVSSPPSLSIVSFSNPISVPEV